MSYRFAEVIKIVASVTAGVAIGAVSQAYAQGPMSSPRLESLSNNPSLGDRLELAQTPIGNLQRRPAGLTIAGEIRSVVGNEFVLDDGTGQIIVDAGPIWYHQLDLQTGDRVTVVGEYDDYDFDAYSITLDGGEVVNIRNAGGPPPWAGGPNRR